MGNGVGIIISIFLLIMIFIVFLISQDIIVFAKEPDLKASLGERFTLTEDHSVMIEDEDLEMKIVEFIYSPCPKGEDCLWSGLRVTLEFTKDGEEMSKNFESKKDFRFVFDYKVIMIDTDYDTYVDLKVEKVD